MEMQPQLTRAQLDQVIAEAQRLALYRQDELLDPEQVRDILQELNLPPDVLEDALTQVHRRQALEQQNRQRKRLIGIAGVVAAVAIAIPGFFFWQQNQTLNRVSAQQGQIERTLGDQQNLKTLDRKTDSEAYYRVVLKDAPVGQQLSLSCDWIDPKGQVVKQNRYRTQPVATEVWPTQCRLPISAATPTGKWTVKMNLEGRSLAEASFDIR